MALILDHNVTDEEAASFSVLVQEIMRSIEWAHTTGKQKHGIDPKRITVVAFSMYVRCRRMYHRCWR